MNRTALACLLLLAACERKLGPCEIVPPNDAGTVTAQLIGSPADPAPAVTYTANGTSLGLRLSPEPASASSCAPTANAEPNGTWWLDLNGDGRKDVYNVAHGQVCHQSGLWLNTGTGFGPNLWTVAVHPAPVNGATLGTSNDLSFAGDMTGDDKVDLFFKNWNGLGTMCVNQGNAAHSDWTGPSFLCYATYQPVTFADVNGDGRIDVETLTAAPYTAYKAYCRTLPTVWRLNNGNPDINTWPTQADPYTFVGVAAPGALLDLNNDGYPDKVQGVETANTGGQGTSSAGLRVSLGQPNGTYTLVTAGVEAVVDPVVKIADVNDDGCLDLATDYTAYKDAKKWYVQNKTGATCLATFSYVLRTALPFNPGARYWTADVDNDGLPDKLVLIHNGYANNDGLPVGLNVYRKTLSGYTRLAPTSTGVSLIGTGNTEYYADNVAAADWDGDGRLDLVGTGAGTMPSGTADPASNTVARFAAWTSTLTTTNRWLKVKTPDVKGFFAGAASIELYDAGHSGDPAYLVTPARALTTGLAQSNEAYHFGVGTRGAVDVRVVFPDGRVGTAGNAATNAVVTVTPVTNAPPVAAFTVSAVTPTYPGTDVGFDGTAATDSDGAVAAWAWAFGDGAAAATATATHFYAAAGTYTVALTVTDNLGGANTATAQVVVTAVPDTTPPSIDVATVTITPAATDNVAVASVTWTVDGAAQAPTSTAPYALTLAWAPTGSGSHVVSCVATDTAGLTSAAYTVTVTKP